MAFHGPLPVADTTSVFIYMKASASCFESKDASYLCPEYIPSGMDVLRYSSSMMQVMINSTLGFVVDRSNVNTILI